MIELQSQQGEKSLPIEFLHDGNTVWTKLWYGVGGCAIVVNIVAMVIEGPLITVISGIVAVLVSFLVLFYQTKLEDTECRFH
jgi:4-hydroxybenzoate polyprenyltransferase